MNDGLLKFVDLPEMVGRALASKELAPLFADSRLTNKEIIAEITPKVPDMLSVLGDTGSALQKTSDELDRRYQDRDQQADALGQRPTWGGFVVVNLGVFVVVLAAAYFSYRWIWPGTAFLMPLAGFVVASAAFIATLALLRRHRIKEYDKARSALVNDPVTADLEGQFKKLREQFRQVVYDKGIQPEVSGILGRATTPSYQTKLGAYTATGLSEVFSSAHEVETQARRDLNDLMKLPGGSIGLAGPRGAGKTTLMALMAARPGPEGKKTCSVVCPAPVEYTGRDFLVTIFLLLCNWVLDDRQPESRVGLSPDPRDEKPAPLWARPLVHFLGTFANVLFLAGVMLVAAGLIANYYQMPASAPVGSASLTADAAHKSANEPPAKLDDPTGATKKQDAQAQPENWRNFPLRYLKTFGIASTSLLTWGAAMLAMWWIIVYFRPWLAASLDRRYYVPAEQPLIRRLFGFQFRSRPEYQRLEQSLSNDSLSQSAMNYSDAMRFQQSYTSGWSGALKLPFGVEGGVNDARTMSRSQRTLPELVGEFRDFLQKLAGAYGRVVIGIDELDKLESNDKAHLFLNEIKAIFGVPNVFYLVSVSENAISAFERRGLPFRDVFDSSFDTIVHVDYLKLAESKDLLKRRTTRIPEPFLCFCHCMSGGLPRDLIRACRDMLEISAEEETTELMSLARRVITHETHTKARGMSIAASKLPGDAEQTQFLSTLTDLLSRSMEEKSLLAGASALLGAADALRDKLAKVMPSADAAIREQTVQQASLAELETEFGLYLAYVGTLLEVFAKIPDPGAWEAADTQWFVKTGTRFEVPLTTTIFDQLAATRQALAVSISVGRQRLIAFRSSQGLENTGITVISAAPPAPDPA